MIDRGLGFVWMPLIIAAVSAGGTAAAARLARPSTPDPSQIAQAEAARAQKNVVYIAGAGILLLFILSAMRR